MKYWKNGFYDELVEGAVEITEEYYNQLLNGQSAGLLIVDNQNGHPILVEYEYSFEDVIVCNDLTAAMWDCVTL